MSAGTAFVLADVQEMLEVEGWQVLLPPTPTRLWMGDGNVEVEFHLDATRWRAELVGPMLQADLGLPVTLAERTAEAMVRLVLAVVATANEEEV